MNRKPIIHKTDSATALPEKSDTPITYTVAQAAALSKLSTHTVRYYERAGLLPLIERVTSSGHRAYTTFDVERLIFLRRMRATGMPIQQLQRYMALILQGDTTADERMSMLVAHRESIEAQIAELESFREILDYKIDNYEKLTKPSSLIEHKNRSEKK